VPIAIVAKRPQGRIYVSVDDLQGSVARGASPSWVPTEEMNQDTPNLVSGRGYGITHWHELFTPRQLVALTTFSNLVGEVRERVRKDALSAGLSDDDLSLAD